MIISFFLSSIKVNPYSLIFIFFCFSLITNVHLGQFIRHIFMLYLQRDIHVDQRSNQNYFTHNDEVFIGPQFIKFFIFGKLKSVLGLFCSHNRVTLLCTQTNKING